MSNLLYIFLGLAFVAYLAWSRYLYHKEILLMLEKGGDWAVFSKKRKSNAIAYLGILAGAILVVYGLACLVAVAFPKLLIGPGYNVQDFVWVGILHPSVGAVVILISLLWLRRSGSGNNGNHESSANKPRE